MSGWLVRRTDHDQLRDQDGMHFLLRGSISTTWPLTSTLIGGGDRNTNRTGVEGFAERFLGPGGSGSVPDSGAELGLLSAVFRRGPARAAPIMGWNMGWRFGDGLRSRETSAGFGACPTLSCFAPP